MLLACTAVLKEDARLAAKLSASVDMSLMKMQREKMLVMQVHSISIKKKEHRIAQYFFAQSVWFVIYFNEGDTTRSFKLPTFIC